MSTRFIQGIQRITDEMVFEKAAEALAILKDCNRHVIWIGSESGEPHPAVEVTVTLRQGHLKETVTTCIPQRHWCDAPLVST